MTSYSTRARALVFGFVLIASACDSRRLTPEDAGVSGLDATTADAGPDASGSHEVDAFVPLEPDAGPPLRGYLEWCTADAQCEPGLLCDTAFPRGFCTRACTTDAACGADACIAGRCAPSCRSGERDCDRYGGSCTDFGGIFFCTSACGSGITSGRCASGLTCDSYRGTCTTTPATSGGDIGDECTSDSDCRSGLCFLETAEGAPTGWLGGYCFALTRSSSGAEGGSIERGGCPEGSVMAPGYPEGDTTYCMAACTQPSDCRPGYYCGAPAGATTGYCLAINCEIPGVPACPAGATCQAVGDIQRCVACTPDCSGRVCGANGCGGTCGTCGSGTTCTAAGLCECVPETDAVLCAALSLDCGTVSTTDRCGAARTMSCGSCTTPETCGAITANQCGCVGETDAELCAARDATCGTITATDGCGVTRNASCGSCTLPETCGGAGVANTCGICTPDCSGRVCGSDGCGGSCGSCGTDERCNTSGACEPLPCDPVRDTLCPSGQKCEWTGSATECVVEGTQAIGDTCVYSTDCGSQLVCSGEGFCREYCTSDSDCRAGRCAFTLSGSPYGLCSRTCDPAAGSADGCNFDESCRLLNTSRATEVTDCGEYGSGFAGHACSSTTDCYAGYACVSGSCREVCRLGTSCTSGTCASVTGWYTYGICPP